MMPILLCYRHVKKCGYAQCIEILWAQNCKFKTKKCVCVAPSGQTLAWSVEVSLRSLKRLLACQKLFFILEKSTQGGKRNTFGIQIGVLVAQRGLMHWAFTCGGLGCLGTHWTVGL